MNELLKFLIAGCVVATTITTGALADTNIVLWSNLGRGGENIRTQVLDHVLTTFEEENPGVTVEVVVIDFKEMAPMLLRAARAEQMPDISMMFSPRWSASRDRSACAAAWSYPCPSRR
jgi:ABC-type glycerol-3-phosphate transport system substrate-binding protein